MADGKRQCSYTVEEKLAVTDRVNSGETQAKVSKDIGIAESTLQGCKPTIDKAMRTWFAQKRLKGMLLSGSILQAQVTKFGNLTGNESFQASKEFISHFKKRHHIAQVSITGESRSASESSANAFPVELKSILQNEDYYEEQLYNCDETALSAKLLPDKTLAFNYKTQKTAGFKKIKDRVIFFLIVIRRAAISLPLFSLAAFITLAALITSIEPNLLYLPFNKTSKIRPLDQGIIQNFKNNYRRELILAIVSCMSSGISKFLKQLNMKEIIYLVKKAWDGVKQKSIENCWMKTLGDVFSVKDGSDSENSSSGTDSEPDFEGFSEEDILQTCTLDTLPEIITEWLQMDEDCPTSEFLSEEEILTGCEAMLDHKSDGENSNNAGLYDNDDDNDEDVVENVKILPTEALSATETVVRFLEDFKTNMRKYFFTQCTVNLWNSLPGDVVQAKRRIGLKKN
uniref:HTH CENPB-type domain-containing protein n=1 Tax=Chrysemys picta bellii TaxID=8478 RepID=A0A8C3FIA7_CHRPI